MARDTSKLHPILQTKMQQFLSLCQKEGLKVGIGECVRSVAEQDALYAQGRTKPGGIVTNAKGSTYHSMHQWGVAFDFYRNDGKGAYNEANGFFKEVGALSKTLGLEWGGDWKSFQDQPHIQLPYWGSSPTKLKNLYATPERFRTTWNPEVPKKTVKKGSSENDIGWLQNELCKWTTMKLLIDRTWGDETENAIKTYQNMLGWNGSGIAGSKTIEALFNGRIR